MKMELDSSTQSFRDSLRESARRKRTLSFEMLKQKKELARIAKREKGKPDQLAAIHNALQSLAQLTAEQLKEIRSLLRQNDVTKAGPVKFVVTERDENGRLKSFKVERT